MIVKRLKRDFSLLDDKLIAHKGIHGFYKKTSKYVKPNSYESCKIAIDNDIPFECDICNTLDNIPVLAHDNTIVIIQGKKIKVNKYTYNELHEILKDNTPSKLEEVLQYNNGRVGVVIDAKEAHIFYPKYRKSLVKLLNSYSQKGEIMLQSFNPFFMLSTRKYLNQVLTCQLICRGKTILNSFRAPKSLAYIYERIISLICFIARTDTINMENHSDERWQKRTRIFISKTIDDQINKGMKSFDRFMDKVQLFLVRMVHDLTKKPILAFTIEKERDFNKMENLHIFSYIVDFSVKGVEEYINMIKQLSKKKNR